MVCSTLQTYIKKSNYTINKGNKVRVWLDSVVKKLYIKMCGFKDDV